MEIPGKRGQQGEGHFFLANKSKAYGKKLES
jgi:hypothetical protein